MYFAGNSDMSYRDYMITSELRSADVETWFNGLIESTTVTDGNFKYLPLDMVLSA